MYNENDGNLYDRCEIIFWNILSMRRCKFSVLWGFSFIYLYYSKIRAKTSDGFILKMKL
jgi:hypothetical protein